MENVKRILKTAIACGMLAALTACSTKKPADKTVTPTQAAASETVTPTAETTPEVTEEPTPEVTPVPTGAPVPEGFSDRELKERAVSAAKEAAYAYRSESVVTGDVKKDGNYLSFDIQADKIVVFYDADGEERLIRYYNNGNEIRTIVCSPFGTLTYENGGTSDPKWTGYFLGYRETDEQGRVTAELKEGLKIFFAYDQNGQLAAKREYDGDRLNAEYLYEYDGAGKLKTETENTFSEGNTLTKSDQKTFEDGKVVLRTVCSEADGAFEKTVYRYEYDGSGSLLTESCETEDGKKLSQTRYSYTKDDKGRITAIGDGNVPGENPNLEKKLYEIKYFDNGPVMIVPFVTGWDDTEFAAPTRVFLPNDEMRTMLEIRGGLTDDNLEKLYRAIEEKEYENLYFDVYSLTDIRINDTLATAFRVPDGESRQLAVFRNTFSLEEYTKLVQKLLKQKEYNISSTETTIDGSIHSYDGNRLTYEYAYGGGGGTGWHDSVKYDDAERIIAIDAGADISTLYNFTYQNGRVAKATYQYTDADWYGEPEKQSHTYTYEYDAAGKLTAINGDISISYSEDDVRKNVKQTFRLTAYQGDGTN
ncbi:MAG: hypothetical protein J5738_05975 [Lachnospiraceae bacterium]|nr:hypothetical protein [Lachnospiraceae bacterium]